MHNVFLILSLNQCFLLCLLNQCKLILSASIYTTKNHRVCHLVITQIIIFLLYLGIRAWIICCMSLMSPIFTERF